MPWRYSQVGNYIHFTFSCFFYTPQGGLKRVAKVQEQGTKNWGWLSREVHTGEGKYATPSLNILVQETDKGQDR